PPRWRWSLAVLPSLARLSPGIAGCWMRSRLYGARMGAALILTVIVPKRPLIWTMAAMPTLTVFAPSRPLTPWPPLPSHPLPPGRGGNLLIGFETQFGVVPSALHIGYGAAPHLGCDALTFGGLAEDQYGFERFLVCPLRAKDLLQLPCEAEHVGTTPLFEKEV